MGKYGYVRVSSKDQNPVRQIEALKGEGIEDRYIYIDRQSGKDFARPQYKRMLKKMKKGDLLLVKSIDRLGRNYQEIIDQWRHITKEKEVNIKVLDMPLLDTTGGSTGNDLTGTFISDLTLQILAYVAETERNFIRQRQAEGIAIAKERGIRFGNTRKELPPDFYEYYDLWLKGRISSRKAAKMLEMSPSTFYRRCKELQEGIEKRTGDYSR